MDRETLVSIIKAHRTDALGVDGGALANERAEAMNHYHGRPYGNEVEGRSQVVSRDLMEAVDWAMPSIMRVFTLAGKLAEFDPVGPEDEALASQESDYVNQVLMKDNPGFMVLHDAIKDTLLLKNGYVKHWWEVEEKTEEESYAGMTLDAITLLFQQLEKEGAEVEVLGQESKFVSIADLPGMPPMPQSAAMGIMNPMTEEVFELRLKITRETGKLIWMAVPSEEVRVSKKCRGSLQESPFVEHVTTKTRSDLMELGMPYDFVYGLAAKNETTSNSEQSYSRDSVSDESDSLGSASGDRSMDEVDYCEAYVRVDYDGDGVAELRKVVTVADEIPPGDEWNEPISAVPMTGFVAKRVPHRHVGESLDDEMADLQEIMTVLKRQLLDNIYLNNNSEIVLNEDANTRDFLTRTPGGVKRVKGSNPVQNAVMPLITKPIIGDILPVLDHFESSKHKRSGIDGANTGVDPDVLQQTTKGAFMENLNRAGQKVEMMIRLLAESGVKESVKQVHDILIRHQDKPRVIQLRGKWVPVNPQEWKNRSDLSVKVGLGTGSEEEKRSKLGMLSQLQGQLLQAVGAAPPPVYEKLYAMFDDVAQTLGVDNPEKYAIAPMSPPHQQILQAAQQAQGQGQSGDLTGAARIQAEADMRIQSERNQANLQVKAVEDQFKREKAMLEARMEAQDREAERRHEVMLQQMKLASDEAREAMKQEVQLILKSMPMDLGQPGISAGVQGSAGAPMPEAMPMQGEMGGMPPQQTMPPDGMME
jgi:hypothetical protein